MFLVFTLLIYYRRKERYILSNFLCHHFPWNMSRYGFVIVNGKKRRMDRIAFLNLVQTTDKSIFLAKIWNLLDIVRKLEIQSMPMSVHIVWATEWESPFSCPTNTIVSSSLLNITTLIIIGASPASTILWMWVWGNTHNAYIGWWRSGFWKTWIPEKLETFDSNK